MKSVKFSSLIKNLNEVSLKPSLQINVLQNELNIAKRSYGLSKFQTLFKRVERL